VASVTQQRRMVEQQRQAQLAVRSSFLIEFLAAWGLLDVANLDAVTPNWLRLVMRLIRAFRQESADSALNSYRELRRFALNQPGHPEIPFDMPDVQFDLGDLDEAERRISQLTRRRHRTADTPPGDPTRVIREPVRLRQPHRQPTVTIKWDRTDKAAENALRVTGPINIKARIARGEDPEKAKRNALVEAAGSAGRHVLNGGRSTQLALVQNDRGAIGWVRVTDGNPCAFCAMLASRGPVYKADSFSSSDPRFTGPGEVKTHDHCACLMVPVFSRTAAWPGRSKEFQELWNAHIQGRYSGKDAIRAWRRLHERPEIFLRKAAENQGRRAA
jgi:hypothetical protein